MDLTEKDIKRGSLILLLLALAVLAIMIVRPVFLAIFGGLILAFVFLSIYKFILRFVRSKNLAAGIVSIIVLLIIFVPLWFLLPLVIKQVFDLFQITQTLDIGGLISKILPSASETLVSQISLTAENALGKMTSSILNSLVDFLVNFAVVALNLFLVAFVFFFALRDEDKLREFAAGLSPLNKNQEKNLVKQFKDMTNSIIFSNFLVGIMQGLIAGLGLYLFGVPNTLILTMVAVVLGILPMLGVGFVYVPVALYLLISQDVPTAVIFIIYNLVFVTGVESVIRTKLVSRKTQVSQVIVLIGMIGGTFVFGILGLLIGPLILAYFITFLKAYKEKTLSSFFVEQPTS